MADGVFSDVALLFLTSVTVELGPWKSDEILRGKYGNFLTCICNLSQVLSNGILPVPKDNFYEMTVAASHVPSAFSIVISVPEDVCSTLVWHCTPYFPMLTTEGG